MSSDQSKLNALRSVQLNNMPAQFSTNKVRPEGLDWTGLNKVSPVHSESNFLIYSSFEAVGREVTSVMFSMLT